MRKSLYIAVLSFLFIPLFANALELSTGPKLVEATPSTLKVQWDKVDKALGYYLYYGTVSGAGGVGYQKQYSEFLETTGATIPSLDAGKDYYVAVTAVDDQGQEGKYSPETVMKTSKGSASTSSTGSKLALQSVNVTTLKSLQLTFSNNLDASSSAQREFKLVKTGGKDELPISSSQVSGNTVTIQLGTELQTGQKYDLTVISLQDASGKSIEAGVDSISTFTVPATLGQSPAQSVNTTGPTSDLPVSDTGTITLASASDHSGNVGQNIVIDKNNTDATAQTNEKLPKTGPEVFILLIISLLVGGGVFYYRRKLS